MVGVLFEISIDKGSNDLLMVEFVVKDVFWVLWVIEKFLRGVSMVS